MMTKYLIIQICALSLASLALAGCTSEPATQIEEDVAEEDAIAAEQFYAQLSEYCGKAFSGKLVSDDPEDSDFAKADMVMHVAQCDEKQIAIPFHVKGADGEWDRSRTWVIHRTPNSLALHHIHRHKDGKEDSVSRYGGTALDAGQANRQEFPVDEFSIELFEANDLSASITNIWAVNVDDQRFAYELRREGRFFRVEFDLSQPVDTPPAPYGGAAPIL
jgi:hypothetical protein